MANQQQQPTVANLVGQTGNLQSGIQQNLGGSQGAPDITQLMRQVNMLHSTQANIMGTSPTMPHMASMGSMIPNQVNWGPSMLGMQQGGGKR